jgi:hypothetical protein
VVTTAYPRGPRSHPPGRARFHRPVVCVYVPATGPVGASLCVVVPYITPARTFIRRGTPTGVRRARMRALPRSAASMAGRLLAPTSAVGPSPAEARAPLGIREHRRRGCRGARDEGHQDGEDERR